MVPRKSIYFMISHNLKPARLFRISLYPIIIILHSLIASVENMVFAKDTKLISKGLRNPLGWSYAIVRLTFNSLVIFNIPIFYNIALPFTRVITHFKSDREN